MTNTYALGGHGHAMTYITCMTVINSILESMAEVFKVEVEVEEGIEAAAVLRRGHTPG